MLFEWQCVKYTVRSSAPLQVDLSPEGEEAELWTVSIHLTFEYFIRQTKIVLVLQLKRRSTLSGEQDGVNWKVQKSYMQRSSAHLISKKTWSSTSTAWFEEERCSVVTHPDECVGQQATRLPHCMNQNIVSELNGNQTPDCHLKVPSTHLCLCLLTFQTLTTLTCMWRVCHYRGILFLLRGTVSAHFPNIWHWKVTQEGLIWYKLNLKTERTCWYRER